MTGRTYRIRIALPILLGAILGSGWIGALEAQEARHLRHILVRNEQIADAILDRLEKGSDFLELARRYSLDVGTRPLGGDLDWVLPQTVEPEFARVAFGITNKGGYDKAKTRHGWHVIQYIDSRPAPGARPVPKPPTPAPGGDTVPPPIPQRNEDLTVTMEWPKVAFESGSDLRFDIAVKNNTPKEIEVFNPELWPLGMIVRYQFGRLNQALDMPVGWENGPPGGFTQKLAGGELLRRSFRLQDYFGDREDWPIVRMIWRGDTLFSRMEKLFPQVIETPGYPQQKSRWRFYRSQESRISILPEYRRGEQRWFLCLYAQGRTWVEIHDPGVPGLIEKLIEQVRIGAYNDVATGRYEPNDYYSWGLPELGQRVPFVQPKAAISWGPGTVSIPFEWDGSDPYIGSSLAVALEKPTSITERAIPIGRIVHTEGDPQPRILELLSAGKPGRMSLALVYPESLIPPTVLEAAAALPAVERLGRPIDPNPKSASKPMLTGADGLIPDRARGTELTPKDPEKKPTAGPIAPDLPRVEMLTAKGRIVVELYEDDAPNTVANFVALVESGFYKSNKIVRREENLYNAGFIQTGSPDNTAQGSPGYSIRDEKNGRTHVVGALSMARKHTQPDSAGSQFFICLDSQPQLDGIYTVFGYVLEGMDVAKQLKVGDVIDSMSILRKREHEYRPDTIVQ